MNEKIKTNVNNGNALLGAALATAQLPILDIPLPGDLSEPLTLVLTVLGSILKLLSIYRRHTNRD